MKVDKYYGTTAYVYPCKNFRDKYGEKRHSQYRIVCKAKSLAEANRMALAVGFAEEPFRRDFTCETGNKEEIEACNEFGFIVDSNGMNYPNNYVNVKELFE